MSASKFDTIVPRGTPYLGCVPGPGPRLPKACGPSPSALERAHTARIAWRDTFEREGAVTPAGQDHTGVSALLAPALWSGSMECSTWNNPRGTGLGRSTRLARTVELSFAESDSGRKTAPRKKPPFRPSQAAQGTAPPGPALPLELFHVKHLATRAVVC